MPHFIISGTPMERIQAIVSVVDDLEAHRKWLWKLHEDGIRVDGILEAADVLGRAAENVTRLIGEHVIEMVNGDREAVEAEHGS